jgi:photosystem II stability/assembly factor-like uncharacterized protein
MIEGAARDNGLVSAIAVHPLNSNVIYIGTAGGGIWRSRDGGATWTPTFDRQLALGIGEPGGLAIDPSNTDVIYAGTSGRIGRGPSAGVFKSTDGGASWVSLGSGYPPGNTGNATQFFGQQINVVLVDPADGNTLYMATRSGCFRSTDSGLNWTAGVGFAADTRSLVLDASSPATARILYAGVSGSGVFQSNNGGRNWTQILNAATPVVAAAVGAAPNGIGKVIVAIAPPTSPPNAAGIQVLYVTLQGTGGAPDPLGVFMSTDQGVNWTQRTATGMPTRTQGGYSFHMAVDPGSPGDGANDIIYFGTVGMARSGNSGATFTSIPVPHADCHAWAFVTQPAPTPSVVFNGSDGGLARSTDAGATWTSIAAGGLQTGLFYNIDIKPDATGSVRVGAPQDNGLQTTTGVAAPSWNSPQGGDGWDVAYDGVTANRVYGTSGFWPAPCTRVFLSNNDGSDFPPTVPSVRDITPWGTVSDQACGIFPIATDPHNAGFVYVAGNQNLWQSRDGGATWRNLSPFASGNTGSVDVARANSNNVAIGAGNRVFVSTNALAATIGAPSGVIFTDITRNLPARNVSRVAFDPNDPGVVYAVLGGFNGGPGNRGHVFRTTISGTTWADISPPLDAPFTAIALDGNDSPTTIYAGTQFGVLRSVDAGASWSVLDDIHFPRVPVLDLVLRNGRLSAGTYGRGVFDFALPQGPSIAVNLEHALSFGTVCTGPEFLTLHVFNVGRGDLIITSVQRLMGSTGFVVLPTPATPVLVAAGEDIEFSIAYIPTAGAGVEIATIRITSNDPCAPQVDLLAIGRAGVPRLVTLIANAGSLGPACLGSFAEETLTIDNAGECVLRITNITSSSPEFFAPGVATYPIVVAPGASTEVRLRFTPTSIGSKSATISISSNDPAGVHTVAISGEAPAPRLGLMLADAGSFGAVCRGDFRDLDLSLFNAGRCTLSVTGITSSDAEFAPPQIAALPLTIAAGVAIEVPLRFAPTSIGSKSATITVTSDDPAGPRTVMVSGTVPSGKLAVYGSLNIGGVTACCCAERQLTICNVGDCKLDVTSVALKRRHRHWKLVNNPFPATLQPGSCLGVVVRYRAAEKCPRCAELVITSDDPALPVKTMELLAYTVWNGGSAKPDCEDCRRGCCAMHVGCSQGFPCCDDEEDADEESGGSH